ELPNNAIANPQLNDATSCDTMLGLARRPSGAHSINDNNPLTIRADNIAGAVRCNRLHERPVQFPLTYPAIEWGHIRIMQFSGVLDSTTLKRTQSCNQRLTDPARIQAVNNTGLMDAGRQAAFDRLAQLAAKIVDAPLTIVSLVGAEKQYFVADYGLPSPFKASRELPIDFSICRYTLEGESIISANALKDPLLKFHPSTGPWGIVALIVIPLINSDGHVLGTFCAIDSKEREWSEYEIDVMRELTLSIMTEINLRDQLLKLETEQKLREMFVAALTHDLRTPLSVSKLSTQLLALKFAGQEDVQSVLSRLDRNLTHADRMIQDLLDASHIKSGKLISIRVTECDPCKIAREVIEELTAIHSSHFELKTINIRIMADPVG